MANGVRHLLLVVAALTFGGGACSGAGTQDDGLSSRALDCKDPISIFDQAPEGWSSTLGVIALPKDRSAPVPRRFDSELGRSFSKFGLVIRADRVFTLTVAESSSPTAIIGWGTNSSDPVQSIEITGCAGVCETDYQPNCPLGEVGEWIVYPGGIWTTDPACAAIDVMTEDETATVELSVGLSCDEDETAAFFEVGGEVIDSAAFAAEFVAGLSLTQ